jgi:E-phenylitaconyl-CoA hydratase
VATVTDDDAIRCVVLTGAGEKAFYTGADLKKTIHLRKASRSCPSPATAAPMTAAAGHGQAICAINGDAFGQGWNWRCDI